MRLLLVEFALAYGSDWFTIPVDVTPGAVFRPQSLVVTDAFGERTVVPHYTASARPQPEWRLFALSAASAAARARGRALPAAGARREPARRPDRGGALHPRRALEPRLGGRAARPEHRRRRAEPRRAATATHGPIRSPQPPDDATGDASYRLATTVPDYWIPFQPQRIDPSKPDIRLRRAAALIDEGGEPGFSAAARPDPRARAPGPHACSRRRCRAAA